MKTWLLKVLAPVNMARFICTTALTTSVFYGCGKPELAEEPMEPVVEPSLKLPIRRVITDTSGRQVTVDIIGREPQKITVVRSLDKKRFDIPIENLSAADAEYTRGLPYLSPPPERIVKRQEEKKETSVDPEVQLLNRRIDEANEEIKELEEQARDLNGGTIKLRSIQSQISRIQKDIDTWNNRIDHLGN